MCKPGPIGGGGGSPALHKPQARKGGETAPIAKRARGTRGRRSSPCTEGGGAPFDPRAERAPDLFDGERRRDRDYKRRKSPPRGSCAISRGM